jgi:hypothetical protein
VNIFAIKKLIIFFLLMLVPIICHGNDLTSDKWKSDLINDPTITYPVISLPLPDYLVPITAPTFNTTITRITGNEGETIYNEAGKAIGVWGDVVRHHYSKDQPWNADESLLYLPNNRNGTPSRLFLDGETYRVKFARPEISGDCRWHETDPDLMMCVRGAELRLYNIPKNTMTVLKTFSGYSDVKMGPYEGNFSADADRVALFARRSDGYDALVYTISTDNIMTITDAPNLSSSGHLMISKSGKFIVFKITDTDSRVFDAYTGYPVCDFPCNQSHYDLGYDEDGITDISFGVSKPSTGNCAGVVSGSIIKHRLEDCSVTVLTGVDNPTFRSYGTHSSMRSNMQGWGISDFSDSSSYPRFRGEVVAIRSDGTEEVKRLAHKRNKKTEYINESHPCPSRKGGRVIYKSNWDNPDGFPVYTFVIDARSVIGGTPILPPNNLKFK